MKLFHKAKETYQQVIRICQKGNCAAEPLGNAKFGLAKIFLKEGKRTKAICHAKAAQKEFSKMSGLRTFFKQVDDFLATHFDNQIGDHEK